MGKKIFMFFLIISILALLFLGGWYYLTLNKRPVTESVEGVPNVPEDENAGENGEDTIDGENTPDTEEDGEEPAFKSDVYSVHLCDGYSDGSFAIRNIKLGMTVRQVIDYEMKNVGVYVKDSDYDKDAFQAMMSDEEEGRDLLPIKERALLGNACEIIYNFTYDITFDNPAEYPYLEEVQFVFAKNKNGVDPDKKIEEAFEDCFGEPDVETNDNQYVATFYGKKEEVTMFYEYSELKDDYNLKYITWKWK